MTRIEMRDVFALLGFTEDWGAMADKQPGYDLNLGNIELKVVETVGRTLRPVFRIAGYARTPRTLRHIRFECPLTVESVEQGVAILAVAVGDDAEPERPAVWLTLGRKWRDRFPLEKAP